MKLAPTAERMALRIKSSFLQCLALALLGQPFHQRDVPNYSDLARRIDAANLGNSARCFAPSIAPRKMKKPRLRASQGF
jgi:hypothetical protein